MRHISRGESAKWSSRMAVSVPENPAPTIVTRRVPGATLAALSMALSCIVLCCVSTVLSPSVREESAPLVGEADLHGIADRVVDDAPPLGLEQGLGDQVLE